MGVNLKNMKRAHDEANRKSEFVNFKSGDSVVYIHPPCRPDDKDKNTSGLNFLRIRVHYNVGPNSLMTVCLDGHRNPLINHPFVRGFMEKRGVDVPSGTRCPVCDLCNSGNVTEDESYNMRGQYKYLWGYTPVKHRENMDGKFQVLDEVRPCVTLAGKTIYDGFMELFYDLGDITDSKQTVFAQVRKTGEKLSTRYKIQAETATLKKPRELHGAFVKKIQASFQDGTCDLFRVAADMVREASEVEAMFAGVQLAEDDDDLDTVDDGWGSDETPQAQTEQLDDVFGGAPKTAAKTEGPDDDWAGPTNTAPEVDEDDAALDLLDAEIAKLTG